MPKNTVTHTIKVPAVIWEAAAKDAANNMRSVNGQLVIRLMSIYKDMNNIGGKTDGKI